MDFYFLKDSRQAILLMRHGQAGNPQVKCFIGQTDTGLTRPGRFQAEALARFLSPVPIERIVCSDLLRCRETADAIAGVHDLPIEATAGLREIYLGDWEGRSFDEIRKEAPELFQRRGEDIARFRTPGGESFADLQARVVPVFEDILARATGTVVVISHAGVNRVILCHWLGMPLERLFLLGQEPGALNVLKYAAGKPLRLLAFNQVPCDPIPQGDEG